MAAQDSMAWPKPTLESPAVDAAAVTPDDNNDLTYITRGLYVGGAGDVAVVMTGGETVTFHSLSAGTLYPFRVSRVKSTGTTATNLVAVW